MQQITADAPLVFLPGTLCDERIWLPVWQHMQINHRSYVPLQWAENLEQMLALTQDRVEPAAQKVHLIGFSLGGYIAALYALKQPEKIASLTLIGYNSEGLSQAEMQSRKLIVKTIQAGKYPGMTPQRLGDFIDKRYLQVAEVSNTVQQMSNDLGGGVLRCQVQSTTPRQPLTKKLANATFPISLIAAENDQIAPLSTMQAMHDRFKKSTLSVVDKSAHMMLLEQPARLATMISANLEKIETDAG